MKKNPHLRSLIEINFAALFISTSGALGRYIELPVLTTTAIRALLACVFLFAYCKYRGISLKISGPDKGYLGLSGLFFCLHWVTYFYALQWSNVAIGMLSIFTYPVITALLEPIIIKTKFQRTHLVLGGLVLLGIYFLVPNFTMGNEFLPAIGMGVLSAVFYSLRNLILKKKGANYNGSTLMFYNVLVSGVILIPALFFVSSSQILLQWKPLLILGLITTAIGHSLLLKNFKKFSVTTISIIASTQPIYGILLGVIFLSEIPSWNIILGGSLILSTVIIESVRSIKPKKT